MSFNTNNIFNTVRGAMGLFSGVNKAKSLDGEDGPEQTLVPEFESKMSDEEIIKLTGKWESDYKAYVKDIEQDQKDNLNYWIGKHYNELQTANVRKPLVDNLIFEAIETFLPIATRGNPQAMVKANGTEEGDKIAKVVTNALAYQAERQGLRMKLKGMTRNWAIYFIGACKIIWDNVEKDIDTKVILPSRLILDPNAEIEIGGIYYGEYLGEKKKKTASKLIKMFPKKETFIKATCQGNVGSKLTYIEWYTPTDLFFTLGNTVLGKFKNPNWNYDGDGVEGKNHFTQPMIPYVFLTVFNLGKRPHDETSLIKQNIPLQDTINKRYQQVEKNVDSQNNGIVLSGTAFTKEQASQAAEQLSKGNALWVPSGPIEQSYKRDQAPALSANVFQHLNDARDELRNIFGTAGSSASGTADQKTVRGKIMINQMDSSRIGGGVTEYIEQVAQTIYNWYVQMMYVYYTEEHSFSIVGPKAQELMSIKNTDLNLKLHVTVKDGSLIPKDPLTKRNEAMDLWSAQAIDPITFYTAMDYPNPYESAKTLLQWKLIEGGKIDPAIMFPDLMTGPNGQQVMPQGQPGQPPVSQPGMNPPNVTSPAVNPQEAKAEIQNPSPDTIAKDANQLITSVKI